MEIQRIEWGELLRDFRWKQGEHLAAIAPTGAGKTTLFRKLMPYRKYNIMFGTKPRDKSYDLILRQGFKRIESIKEINTWDNNYLLWPRQRKTIPETMIVQRDAFREAMNVIVHHGSWTLWVDEAKYITEMLKLRTELTYCLEQLRSIDATIICGAQRPSYIPPSVLSNSSHIFLWKTTEENDQKKLADIGGVDSRLVKQEAKTLDEFEFIYIKSRGTQTVMVRSEVKE
jgi:hypothetical protein